MPDDFAEQKHTAIDRLPVHEAQDVLETAQAGAFAVSAEVRREALAALRRLAARDLSPRRLLFDFIGEFRKILERYEPILARTVTQSQIAAYLKAGLDVLKALPEKSPDPAVNALISAANEPPEGPPPVLRVPAEPGEPKPPVRFPIIEEAAYDLQRRRVMTASEFYGLNAQERLAGFTVSRIASLDAIEKIEQHLMEAVVDGDDTRTFVAKVEESLDGSGLSPSHLEQVLRNGVLGGYARGLKALLANDFVGRAFPFVRRYETRDSRLTPLCQRLSSGGLATSKQRTSWGLVAEGHLAGRPLIVGGRKYYTGQPVPNAVYEAMTPEQRAEVNRAGSQWYWRGDKFWQEHAGPQSHFGCRCSATAATIEQAARAGVIVAQRWLETGVQPAEADLCVVPFDVTRLKGYSPEWTSVWAA